MSREEIARDSMSQIEFKRWQILIKKIDDRAEKISELDKKITVLRRELNEFYLEMQKLWDFVRSNRK